MSKQATGQEYTLINKVLVLDRVSKTTDGGRTMSFRCAAVVGDGQSKVGFGTGKDSEVPVAIQKAMDAATKNMIHVQLNNGTIQHEAKVKFGSATIFMKPASEGTGVIAGSAMRAIFECLGVRDVLSKCISSSSNALNVARATMKALESMKSPKDIARIRGISVNEVLGVESGEKAESK
ncbi:MAG: 30S ribosomal protein S5 [Gammaproteobacteria bacterium]|jgi:small subunit ribosomal protein S5|nr:30S ribosomal protein S5 [Gammaproteobacteria bacterium]